MRTDNIHGSGQVFQHQLDGRAFHGTNVDDQGVTSKTSSCLLKDLFQILEGYGKNDDLLAGDFGRGCPHEPQVVGLACAIERIRDDDALENTGQMRSQEMSEISEPDNANGTG